MKVDYTSQKLSAFHLAGNRLVVVHWLDSFGGGGWNRKSEFEPRVSEIVSAGLLIGEEPDYITLTTSVDVIKGGGNDPQYLDPISIPKRAITFMADVELPIPSPEST